jgi:hypothetical protein
MKLLSCGVIISLLAFSGCKPKQEGASNSPTTEATDSTAIKITAADPSPHFAEVMSHLDVGGKALNFVDHEGRREFWIGLIDSILSSVPKEKLPVKVDAAKLLDESGLMQSAASGQSISKDGKSWLMRSYSSYPDGLPKLMKMLGEKEDFVTASRLPATTDLSVEAQLNATILADAMRRYCKLLGQEEMIEQGLKQPTPFGADIETLLAGMDLNILLGVDLEPTLIPQMPVMPLNVFLQVSAKKELIDLMMPFLSKVLEKRR